MPYSVSAPSSHAIHYPCHCTINSVLFSIHHLRHCPIHSLFHCHMNSVPFILCVTALFIVLFILRSNAPFSLRSIAPFFPRSTIPLIPRSLVPFILPSNIPHILRSAFQCTFHSIIPFTSLMLCCPKVGVDDCRFCTKAMGRKREGKRERDSGRVAGLQGSEDWELTNFDYRFSQI